MNKYFIRFNYNGIGFSRIVNLNYNDISIDYIQNKISENSLGEFPIPKIIDIITINSL